MLVTKLYRVSLSVISASLRSSFKALLVDSKKWSLLLSSEGIALRIRIYFIVSGVSSPQSFPVFTCWGLFP